MDLDEHLRIIRDLEKEIGDWRSKNSQSNPGAVMELRDMRKQLAVYQATYEKLLVAKLKEEKAGSKGDSKN
jgi:hypothetical protein